MIGSSDNGDNSPQSDSQNKQNSQPIFIASYARCFTRIKKPPRTSRNCGTKCRLGNCLWKFLVINSSIE